MPTNAQQTKPVERDQDGPAVIDTTVLRRERDLGGWHHTDWHNERRVDPPASSGARTSTNRELGLITVTLSVEEIDVVLDRLDGSIGCADPVLCDVVAILAGARAQQPADVAPAAWGVR
jgi:hypothetical protein